MSLSYRKRLSTRISIWLTLLFALCIFILSILSGMAIYSDARAKADEGFKQAKGWTQKIFAEPIWNYDEDLIQELAKSLIASSGPFIRHVAILDRDGQIMGEAGDGSEVETGDLVEGFPVIHQGEQVGRVLLRARPEGMFDYLERLTTLIWTSAGLMTLALAAISFFTLERLLTRPLAELIQSMNTVERAQYKVTLRQQYFGELEILASSYRRAISGIEVRDETLQAYASNLENLVEDRTAERDVERMKAVNAARLASLGEVSAGLAHEVNNPLTVIQGTVHLIENHLEKGESEKVQPHLQTISRMVARINSIVKGLKYLSRDGASDPSLEFSVNRMIAEVQSLCMMQMEEKGIAFTVTMPEHEIRIRGQEVQISQVVVNLIQNAADAVIGIDKPRVQVEVEEINGHCQIRVLDNGPGVATELREKIFQPFFTTKPIGKGTGLGLSIAQGIVRQHGGEIVVDRVKNQTVFELQIASI